LLANGGLQNSSITVTAGTGLSGGGSVALGGSTSLTVQYGSTTGTAVQGDTQITCASGTGNLSGGGGTITLGTGGSCGSISITNSPTFSGTLTVTGAGGVVVGAAGTTDGSLVLANSGNAHFTTLQGIAPAGQDQTIIIPATNAAGGTDTVCLLTLANCTGTGGGVTSSGYTANYITKYSGVADQITPSQLFDNGTSVGVGTNTPGAGFKLDVNGNVNVGGTLTVGSTATFNGDITQSGTGAFTTGSGAVTLGGNTSISGTKTLTVGTGAVSFGGVLGVTGLTTLSGGATIAGTVTLSGLASAGVVHTDASGVLSTGPVALGTDTSGSYVASIGTLTGLSTSGNSGAGSTPTLSVLYGSAANTAVQGNTTITCASGSGNLTGGGGTITLGSGGSCGSLTIVNSPTFSGDLAVQGSGGVSIGVAGTTAGLLKLANDTNTNLATIQSAVLGQATLFTLPDPGQATATICLSTGNCAGAGGGITGSGTSGKLAKFNSSGSITDSTLSESGTTLTASGNVLIQGSNSLSVGSASTNDGSITFYNSVGAHTVTLQAPSSDPASNLVFKLPSAYGANGDCLKSDGAGALTFTACTGGVGGGVTSLDSQTGVLTLANSSGASGTITIDNASTTAKGIAQFNSSNFSVASGVVNTIQDIGTGAAPTFSGLSITNSATIGAGLTVTTGGATISAGGLTVSAGGAAITGNSTINGTLSGLTGLTSSGTITFSTLTTAGVVHNSAAGVLSTGLVALGADTSGNYLASLGSVTGLTIGGTNGVAGGIPTLSVNYGALANTAAQGNTALVFNGSGNLTGSISGTAGGGFTTTTLTVVNNPTFSGLVTANGGLTVASGATIAGTITLSDLATAGVLHTNASGVVSTGAVALGGETSGNYVASLGTMTGLTLSGTNGSAGAVPNLSVNYGSSANTAAQGNTALTFNGSGNLTGSISGTAGGGFTTTTLTVVNNPTFSGLVTANGGLTIANGQQLTNAGSTLNTSVAISDKATGGAIGTAAATVDAATSFTVNQTTAGQTLSLPAPTSATAGRIAYVANIGTTSFTMHGVVIAAGQAQLYIWNGSAWVASNVDGAGAGATSVVNDTNIQGSISSNVLTLAWAGQLSVARGGTGAGSFTSNGILFGNGSGALQVTASANNAVLVTDGSGNPSLAQLLPAAVQGNITTVGALASGSIASGFGTISTGNNITTTATVQGGSVNATGSITLGGANINTAGTLSNVAYLNQANTFTNSNLVKTTSATAFQIQNAGAQNLFVADTSNQRVTIGAIGSATGQFFVGGSVPAAVLGNSADGAQQAVAVQGKYAYVGDEINSKLKIYDISNPASPVLISSSNAAPVACSDPLSIAVEGRYVYIGNDCNFTLDIFDISNPAAPVNVSGDVPIFAGIFGDPNQLYIQGRYLYAVTSGGSPNRLMVIDVANPAKPVTVGTVNIGAAYGLYVVGRYAYYGDITTNQLKVADVSNPASPSIVGSVSITAASGPYDVYVQGRYAYVPDGTKLTIIDVSNPSSPTITGSVVLSASAIAYRVNVSGRYAYVTDSNNAKIYMVDVTNPASPSVVGNVSSNVTVNAFNVQGRYAFVAANNGLQTYDLGGAYVQQLEVGSVDTSDLSVKGNAAIVGDLSLQGGLAVGGNAQFNGNIGASGQVLLQNASNSTAAFEVKNAAGSSLFKIDTTNGLVSIQGSAGLTLGVASTTAGTLVFNNASNAHTTTLKALAAAGQDQTITIPASSAATDTVCLLTLANCGSGATGVTTIGTIDSQTKSADGAVISGVNLYLQTADASFPGLVSTGAQTFAGAKTFNAAVTLGAAGTALNVTNNASIGGTLGITGASTFTGLGTFNGGISVANNSNFSQSGSGTFSTGTGAVSLNGAATVSSTLTVQGAGGLTLGVQNTTTGKLNLATNLNNNGITILQAVGPSSAGNATISIPAIAGGTSDTVCLVSLGNCGGSGGGITGTGTSGKLAVFTGTGTIGSSASLSESGSALTASGTLTIQGASVTLGTSSQAGSLVLNDGSGHTTTLQAGVTAANLSFILPTTLGSGSQCLKNTATPGTLTFANCNTGSGSGGAITLQDAYDASNNPATITLATTKDLQFISPDVATDPSILFNLQCATCSANGGRFGVQNAGTDVFTVNPNGTIVMAGTTSISGSNTFTVGTGATTLGGSLTIAGITTINGSQFNQNGSTLFGVSVITDKATGGAIGTAAATVDVKTSFTVNQTTAGQTLSLPNPTSATAGRVVYVANIGTTSFIMHGVTIASGAAQQYVWNGSAWTPANIDGAGAGVTTIGTLDAQSKSANGAVISGNNIFLQTADASFPGLVSTGAQTFAGAKTFSGVVTLSAAGTALSVTNNASVGGTLGVTGLTTVSGGLTATGTTSINTTGTANTSIGNATGTFALTSNGGLNVTTGGALSGISTLSLSGAITGATSSNTINGLVINSGALSGVTGITTNGGYTQSGSAANTFTGATTFSAAGTALSVTNDASVGGALSVTGNLTVTGAAALKKGTDFSTTGASNDVSFGSVSLVRLTGASAQTITGIAGGTDGRLLTIVNAAGQAATISNANAGSAAANRISTGTGSDISLPAGASITLIYDSGASLWRITSAVAGASGSGVTAVGAIDSQTKSANGAVISSNTIYLQTADCSGGGNPGLVSTGAQCFTGGKTFNNSVTVNSSLTASGGAVSLTGNAASSFTTSAGALTLTSAAAATWSTAAGNLTLQAGSGTVSLGTSTSLTASGALSVTSGGATTMTIDAGGAAALNLGTGSANAVSISKSGVTTTVNGALTVTQAGSFSSTLAVTSDFSVNTNKFTVTAATGNTSVGGTLSSAGDFAVNTNKFNVTASNGNTSVAGTLGVTGNTTLSGNLDVTGAAAFKKGTDFATTGSSNNVAFGSVSLVRLTGASAQTITGIAGGTDGRLLTLVNAASQAAIISNLSASSSAANQISTGTGNDLTLPAGASITLIYDNGASLWRVTSAVAGSSGSAVTSVGAIDTQTKSANGAVISGNAIYLQTADGSNVGLVSTGVQTFAGAKTFSSLITGSAGATISGGAIALTGNAASSFTTSSGALTLTSAAAATWSTAAGNLTLQAGSGTVSLGTSTSLTASGALSVTSGGATTMTIDAGGAATLNLGTGSANAVSISKSGVTTTINGALTVTQAGSFSSTLSSTGDFTVNTNKFTVTATNGNTAVGGTLGVTGLITASGGLTVAANQNLTLNSGTGTFTQTYASSGTGTKDVHTTNATNSNATATATTVNANTIGLTGTASGNNTLNGINFNNVTTIAGNTFNALNVGTGYNSALVVGGSAIINGSGLLQNAGIDSALTYTNLQKVGALSAGSIASGFGTISTTNSIATTSSVQGGTGVFTGASSVTVGTTGAATGSVLFKGSTAASGTLTLIGQANPTNNTLTLPNETGTLCSTGSVCAGYAAASGGNYIAKNTNDTSSASFVGNLLGLTNTNTGAAGVLSLTNSGTNSALSILQSGTSEPSAGQALILANNNTTTPSGNLLDLQNKGTSKFSVDTAGAATASGLFTGSAGLTITGAAVSLNASSNFNTSINTGTSTGAISIGNSASTGFTLENGSSTVNLFNGATAHTIQLATGAAAQTVTIGSTNGASALNLQAGTGSINLAAGNLVGGQIAVIQNANITANTAGTTRGYQFNSTISNTASANTNIGFEINQTDNSSNITDFNTGLAITLSGTNIGQRQYGADINVNAGIALRGVSTSSSAGTTCAGQSAGSVGVCADSQVNSTNGGTGLYARSAGGSAGLGLDRGAGVFATSDQAGTAGTFYTGVIGTTQQTAAAAYTSIGVLGKGKAGTGATVYGGYYTLDTANTATSGAALYATTPTYSTAAAGNGINAVNVLQAAGGTGQAVSAITGVTAGAGAGISLVSGNGGAATGASGANVGGAGGTYTIQGGNGGAATSGTGGNGAGISLTAGNGGNGSTAGGSGGSITLSAGSAGTGGTGTAGSVKILNAANSTAAFLIQKASASDTLFTADTTNNRLTVGNATAAAGTDTTLFVVDSAATANLPTGVNGGLVYDSTLNRLKLYENGAYATICTGTNNACSGANLQGAYTASTGSTTPEILLDSTRNGVDIQDNSLSAGTTLFAVRGTATPSTLGTALFSVNNRGETVHQTTTNSTTALQIQNSSSAVLFDADTSNMRLGVNVTYTAMSAPSGLASTPAAGGSLTAGSYRYEVTAVDSLGGETGVSNEVTGTTSGGNLTNSLTWTAVTGASAYHVYRTASGGGTGTEKYLTTVYKNAYSDTGSVTLTSTSPPSSNTAYVSTNISNSLAQLSIGGNGTPTGQLYVSGTQPTDVTKGGFYLGSAPVDTYTQGRYTYIATTTKLIIIDTTNPAAPVDVTNGGFTTSMTAATSVYVQGRYAYMVGGSKLSVIDVSSPASPKEVYNGSLGANTSSIAVSGRYAYVTDPGTNNLRIVDVSNPASPVEVAGGRAKVSAAPYSVFISGHYAYVTGNFSKLYIFDISNPADPVDVTNGGATTAGIGATSGDGVFVQGRYAYVAVAGKLVVFDVSNPASPVDVSNGGLNEVNLYSVYVQGRYAYIVVNPGTNLKVVDISNPYAMSDVSSVSISNGPKEAKVVGRYAYLANTTGNILQIFDLGGAYSQQLEAGGIETGTLQVNSNATISGDTSIQGGLNVSAGLQVTGNAGVNGSLTLNAVSLSAPATFTDTTAAGGSLAAASYYYKVAAVNGTSISSAFSATSAYPLVTALNNQNTLTWGSVTGATGYIVYRSTDNATWFSNTFPTSVTSIVDNGSTYTWGNAATPLTTTDKGGNLIVGGWIQGVDATGTNVAGSNLTINGGAGTGTGVGGNIVFQYAPAGSSGVYTNALQTACVISGTNGSLSCPGGTASSERFGAGSSVNNVRSVAVGNGAVANGQDIIAIGYNANVSWGGGSNVLSVGIGSNLTINGQSSVGVGYNISGVASNSVSIGGGSFSTGAQSVAIGAGANTSNTYDVVIGYQATANLGGAGGSVVIGNGAHTGGQEAVIIGDSATAATGSIAIGVGATASSSGQLVIGGSSAIQNAYIGNGVTNAAPTGITLQATGGSGTDIAGGSFTLAGGIGTGAGNGGNINFQVAKPGSTGSGANSLATVASLSGVNGAALFKNSANSTTAFQIQNTSGVALLGVDTTNSKIFSGIADGASAVGLTLNTSNNYATSGAKLLSLQNNGTEKFNVDKDGNITIQGRSITGSGGAYIDFATGTSGNVDIFGASGRQVELHNGTDDATRLVLGSSGAAQFIGSQLQFYSIPNNAGNIFVLNAGSGTQATETLNFNGSAAFGTMSAPTATLDVQGNANVKTTTNSTTGFKIQSSTSQALFTADTTNMRLGVNVTYAAMTTPSGLASSPVAGGSLAAGAYKYEVTAIDSAGGETAVSNEVTGTTAGGNLTNSLTWTAVTGASGYRIYRTAISGGTGTEKYLTTVLKNSYSDTGSITLSSINPPSLSTAYTSSNVSSSQLALSVGGLGSPTGQLYVSGTLPTDITKGGISTTATNLNAHVQAVGRYTYVMGWTNSGAGTLQIFDTSNPASPVDVSNGGVVAAGGLNGNFYVLGRYAYTVGSTFGNGHKLSIIDISNPAAPTNVSGSGLFFSNGDLQSVYAQGKYVYVLDITNSKLYIADVSNPASPFTVGSVSTGSGPVNLTVQGRYAYVVNGTANTLQVIDVSNPYSPSSVGTISTGASSSPYAVAVSGRYAYIANHGTSKLMVIDISNPSSPVDVSNGGVSTTNSAEAIQVHGRYAYITGGGCCSVNLQVFDISNPAKPIDVSSGGVSNSSYGDANLSVQGRYAYVINNASPGKLQVFDLGGEYTQQLEAGGAEFGTLTVDTNASFASDASVAGGLNVGQSLNTSGNMSVAGTSYFQGAASFGGGIQGGLSVTGLSAPGAPTVTPVGTSGGTSYSYTITALGANGGETTASSAGSTASGNASLSSSNYNQIAWTSVSGAVSYKVYRTVGGASQGLIGTTKATTLSDTGIAAGTSSPTANSSGFVGIGTASPSGMLEVAGDLRLSDSSGANDWQIYREASSGNLWINPTQSAGLAVQFANNARIVQTSGSVDPYTFLDSTSSHQLFKIDNAGSIYFGNNTTGSSPDVKISRSGSGNLNLQANGTSNTGVIIANTNNSTAAFQIQSASAADTLFTASTSTNKLVVGNATGTDTATTLLQLDSATADPTSNLVNGSMYYNSSTNKFRCYQNAAWQDCIGTNQTNTFQLNGNSFAQAASLGTNDNFSLGLRTSGTNRLTINSGTDANAPGGVGIGTTAGSNSTYTLLQAAGTNASTTTSGYLGYLALQDTASSESGQVFNFGLSVESKKTGTLDRNAAGHNSINGGIFNNVYIQGGTAGLAYGMLTNISPTGGNITSAIDYLANGVNGAVSASGTVSRFAGFQVNDYGYAVSGSQYGLYVADLTSGTTDYAIYTNSGSVRFGDTLNVQTANVAGSGNTAANIALNVQGGTGQTSTNTTGSGGGAGSAISLATGAGGATATAQLNAVLVGGAGGAYTLTTGTGGQANQGALGGNVTGGAGGDITITSGSGGAATGSAGNSRTGGRGGDIALQGGSGGTGSSANGRNGYVTLQANGGNVGIGTSTPANLLSIGALTTAASGYQIAVTTGGTTNSGIVVQTVAGQSSGNILQAQDSTGAALATIDYQGNLTVKSATIAGTTTTFATLTLSEAHFKSTQTNKPTIGTPASCGTSPSATVANSSTDSAGSFTITSGTSTTGVCTTTFTFNKAYGGAPKAVILSGANTAAGAKPGIVTGTSTTTFTFALSSASATGTAYTYYYWVIE
jgi:hypothetical protein